MNPHQVTRDFEKELCAYTGAPYAVTTTSCTMALLLAVAWNIAGKFGRTTAQVINCRMEPEIEIPKRTYVSVPQSIIHAGGRPTFRDEEWFGYYQLKPLPVWDCARFFSGAMYTNHAMQVFEEQPKIRPGGMQCVSFHTSKILGDTQGGAILHDDPEADAWLRRARFDGRTEGVPPKDDRFDMIGYHAYLSPDVAARLLWKLSTMPFYNDPLPNDPYPDLSTMEIFK